MRLIRYSILCKRKKILIKVLNKGKKKKHMIIELLRGVLRLWYELRK